MVEKQAKFISLRWRITVPLFALTLIVVMVGIYVLVSSTGIVFSDSTANILQQSQHEVLQRSADLHEEQRRIVRTLALLSGVPEAVQSGSADTVRSALETRANNAGLDLLALTDDRGRLVLGLLRGQDSGTFARISVLDTPSLLEPAGEATDWTGLVHIANVSFVTTAAPISQAGVQIGHVFAGQRLSTVIETFKPSAMTDAVVYTQEGSPTATTLNLGLAGLSSLSTAASPLQIEGQYYQALDFPFSYGDSTLGTFRLLVPDNSRQSAIVARQLGSLLLTLLAAVVVIALFVSSHWSLGRTERIQRTAESLARGERRSRTHLRPVDEIGRAGQALDQYAELGPAASGRAPQQPAPPAPRKRAPDRRAGIAAGWRHRAGPRRPGAAAQ